MDGSLLIKFNSEPHSRLTAIKDRLSRERVATVYGRGRGSIRSSRRSASRERWSSSTLGTLWLHRLVLGMAPSIARRPPSAAGSRTVSKLANPGTCVSHFTHRRRFIAAAPDAPDQSRLRPLRNHLRRRNRIAIEQGDVEKRSSSLKDRRFESRPLQRRVSSSKPRAAFAESPGLGARRSHRAFSRSFDRLVGARKDRLRYGEAGTGRVAPVVTTGQFVQQLSRSHALTRTSTISTPQYCAIGFGYCAELNLSG
jgi:hypothetical protein